MAASRKNYQIPLIKPNVIATSLSSLDPEKVSLDPENLENPQNLQRVYEVIVEWLLGVTSEELEVSHHFQAMGSLQHPSLYDEAFRKTILLRHLAKLFQAVSIKDHDLTRDHANPTKKRVHYTLSAIINFAMYREDRLTAFEQLNEESEQMANERMELQQQNESLLHELESLKAQRAEAEPVIQRKMGENRDLAEGVAELNSEHAKILDDSSKLQQKIEDLRAQNMKDEEALNALKQQIRRLKSQIVESPEKTKQYIENLASQVEQLKEEITAGERCHREMMGRLDTIVRTQREVGKAIEAIEGCSSQREKVRDPRREIKDAQQRVEELERKERELCTEIEHYKKSLEHFTEKTQYDKNRFHSKLSLMEQRHEKEASKLKIANREGTEAQEKIRDSTEQIRLLEIEKAKTMKKHKEDMAVLKANFDDLENSVSEYHRRLVTAMSCPL